MVESLLIITFIAIILLKLNKKKDINYNQNPSDDIKPLKKIVTEKNQTKQFLNQVNHKPKNREEWLNLQKTLRNETYEKKVKNQINVFKFDNHNKNGLTGLVVKKLCEEKNLKLKNCGAAQKV